MAWIKSPFLQHLVAPPARLAEKHMRRSSMNLFQMLEGPTPSADREW